MADKKSDIVPKLIEDAEQLRMAAEALEIARLTLVEGQNQLKDEMAGYQAVFDEAEKKIRAHVMAGGSLPGERKFKLVPVAEKETINYVQEALAEFEAWCLAARPSVLEEALGSSYKKTVVVYDGEALAKAIASMDDTVMQNRFNRCIKREIKPATTMLIWSKT